MNSLKHRHEAQRFANEYSLVNGVTMHAEFGEQFGIPHPLLKRYVGVEHFVELRIDSPRFSVHQEDAAKCSCPSCDGEMSKPILRHDHPATLMPLPPQDVPARGWGEDFWVQITGRDDEYFSGRVDNPLVESRLHQLDQNDDIFFHSDELLAVHPIHRQELVASMQPEEIKELVQWLSSKQ